MLGVKNADGSVCYIIGVRKDIRSRIGKRPGDRVLVTVRDGNEGRVNDVDVSEVRAYI